MYSIVKTAALQGIRGIPVYVEADISRGMPVFEMVGFLASEVKEAKERVRIGLKNSGIELPPSHMTINFTPADIRKSGSWFDLAVAAAVLCAMGVIPQEALARACLVGEIGLNGEVLPVRGILPAAVMARDQGERYLFLPEKNKREGGILDGLTAIPVGSLKEFVRICREGNLENYGYREQIPARPKETAGDFSEIRGQQTAKRACEIAVSGMHNLLMIGPPGSGKTMLAKRMPGILPQMNFDEMLELTQIYSVCGRLEGTDIWKWERPFVAPHHTITPQGLCGGGKNPMPGALSMAHKGILFMDEFPEFPKEVIELLRQPMEEKTIRLMRLGGSYEYPCDCLFLAAMNPCRCGYFPDLKRCRCTPASVASYLNKISQPILDRIELSVEMKELTFRELRSRKPEETSAQIRKRVEEVHRIQRERFRDQGIYFNGQMSSADTEKYCQIDREGKDFLEELYQDSAFSARGYYKLLKTARTIADMDASSRIQCRHLEEAAAFKAIDKKYWEGWNGV